MLKRLAIVIVAALITGLLGVSAPSANAESASAEVHGVDADYIVDHASAGRRSLESNLAIPAEHRARLAQEDEQPLALLELDDATAEAVAARVPQLEGPPLAQRIVLGTPTGALVFDWYEQDTGQDTIEAVASLSRVPLEQGQEYAPNQSVGRGTLDEATGLATVDLYNGGQLVSSNQAVLSAVAGPCAFLACAFIGLIAATVIFAACSTGYGCVLIDFFAGLVAGSVCQEFVTCTGGSPFAFMSYTGTDDCPPNPQRCIVRFHGSRQGRVHTRASVDIIWHRALGPGQIMYEVYPFYYDVNFREITSGNQIYRGHSPAFDPMAPFACSVRLTIHGYFEWNDGVVNDIRAEHRKAASAICPVTL